MSEKLRIAQYGCGNMSVYTMRYVFEKGAEIVAAFDKNPNVIGKDIGDIIGTEKKGVIVQDASQAEKVFKEDSIHACIVTTMSLLKDVEDALMVCASNGINAITICEEAIYPWNSNPTLTQKIDAVAKENNCTITGSGYQDVYWGNLITTLAGSSHNITKIIGKSSYNVEHYGIALAKGHGAGLDFETFEKEIASADNISNELRQEIIKKGDFLPSYMWNVNGWLSSKLGLTVVSQSQKCVPQTHTEDLPSKTLGITIKAGNATGMSAVVTTHTEEGIIIESECIGKVYAPGEVDRNEWTLIGEPNTKVVITEPSTVELTCATVVNRLPELIDAEPGYITSEKLTCNNYKVKALHHYLTK